MIKKIFIILLLLSVPLFAQQKVSYTAFASGSDTIANINQQDTLQYSITYSGLNWCAWENVTQCLQASAYISAADKTGEVTKVYDIANETDWTWAHLLRLRIVSAGDTITSSTMTIGDVSGALTIFIQPDTTGTNTVYDKVRVGGL